MWYVFWNLFIKLLSSSLSPSPTSVYVCICAHVDIWFIHLSTCIIFIKTTSIMWPGSHKWLDWWTSEPQWLFCLYIPQKVWLVYWHTALFAVLETCNHSLNPCQWFCYGKNLKRRAIFTAPLRLFFKFRIHSDINKMQIITQGRSDSVMMSIRSQRSWRTWRL